MREPPRRPGRVGQTLQDVLQRIDPEQRLGAYRLWVFWKEAVGESIAARAEPVRFRRGVLSVRVAGHTWMQELQFLKENLRERLNARLGAEHIREIYFVSAPEPAAAAPEEAPARPNLEPVAKLPPLSDPRLEEVFARIAAAHARRRPRRGARS